jgi:transcriptional regulator with XRE-family HTH domain
MEPTTLDIEARLRQAVIDSGLPYLALARETGVARMSIQRFALGRRTIRLDVAAKLATYFGLELVRRADADQFADASNTIGPDTSNSAGGRDTPWAPSIASS